MADALVEANGGMGGYGSNVGELGGDGGEGRIRIEYCSSYNGSTSPTASTEKLKCYVVEQIDADPFDQARLYIPESFTDGRTYIVQFARRFELASASELTKDLQLTRQVYGSAKLEALVSNTGVSTGPLNLCLDIGNDGTCDFTHDAVTDFPAEIEVTGLADALNDYLQGLSGAYGGDPVDVPVRVQIDRAADVMLTNLALVPAGSKTRFVRLSAVEYEDVRLSLEFLQPGVPSGPLAFTVDVGADGSVDWSYSSEPSFPAVVTSPNLEAFFDAYLAGRSGEVDVPLRIVPSPFLDTAVHSFNATPSAQPDVKLAEPDIDFGVTEPTEGDTVPVVATLHNEGGLRAVGLTAAFYATSPGWGEWYVGSAYVPEIPAGGTAEAAILWNTLGFTGTVPLRVVADPYDRLVESQEGNNEATTQYVILTRPDLLVPDLLLSDGEPVVGQTVIISLTVQNRGQTAAGTQAVVVYDGNPGSGGTQVCEDWLAVAGGDLTVLECSWIPETTGPYRLFTKADRDNEVDEYDEANNEHWRDLYVGFAGPVLLDSGGAPDPAYTPAQGHGYLNGEPSTFCGDERHQSQRTDTEGTLQYRFDHLLPNHYYHLDLTLYECDGLGRQQRVSVDDLGNVIADAVDLSDGDVHRPSFLLDPAFYGDHSFVVNVEELSGYDAVVSAVDLHDIDYRYVDAGNCVACDKDPQYPAPGAESK